MMSITCLILRTFKSKSFEVLGRKINFMAGMATMDVVLDLYRSTNERVENKMCTLYRGLMMSDHLPSLEDVKQAVGNNIIYTLYVEIWYRHPGSSSNPTFRQRWRLQQLLR